MAVWLPTRKIDLIAQVLDGHRARCAGRGAIRAEDVEGPAEDPVEFARGRSVVATSRRLDPDEAVRSRVRNRKGEPFRESKLLTRVLQPAAESAGLGRVTWHQFRHIHSSLLNDLRVPVKIAQEQLGHASISTTLGIYTHVVDASRRAAVTAVEERLLGVMLRNAPKSAPKLETTPPASNSVSQVENWRRRPDLNRGWRFCRFRWVVVLVARPRLLVPRDGRYSLVFGR
jgi:hypothetical protein